MHSCFLKGTRLVVEEARPKESEGCKIILLFIQTMLH